MGSQGMGLEPALSWLSTATAYVGLIKYVGVRVGTGWALKPHKERLKTSGTLRSGDIWAPCNGLRALLVGFVSVGYHVASLLGSCCRHWDKENRDKVNDSCKAVEECADV